MSNFRVTVRLNIVSDTDKHELAAELVEWLDANLPLRLRPTSISTSVYEDVLIREQVA